MTMAAELKLRIGKWKLIGLAEQQGLKRKGGKIQCPARCSDKADSCSVGEKDGVALWHCHRCKAGGDAIGLIETARGWDFQSSLTWLAENEGLIKEAPWRKPKSPPPDSEKLWAELATADGLGEEYLRSRGLLDAVALGAVRFNAGSLSYPWLNVKAREGFRVAVRLFSVKGKVSHLQLRSVLAGVKAGDSKRSTPGTYPPGGVAMGCVKEAVTAPRVYLAEGIADTLALQIAGIIVIGAPGADQLMHLRHFLGNVRGRQIVVCPQNDQSGQSRRAFAALADKLVGMGSRVVLLPTPKEHKDPADWLKAVGLDEFKAMINIAIAVEPPKEATTGVATPVEPAGAAVLAATAESDRIAFGKTYASLCHILRHNRRVLPEPLRFDEMLWSPATGGRALEDQDTARIRELIELEVRNDCGVPLKFGIDDIERAVVQVAHEQRFHPVRDYLNSLTWDGIPRLDAVGEEVLGIARTEINQLLLRKWFIGAANRPLEPGCKMDTVLTLVGRQYLGKSTFFSTLMNRPEWFSDAHVDVDNRDSLLILQSVWLLEWAELATMQRARDLETLKSFITSRNNRFRMPYGRRIVDRPRHAVIVGTTNKPEFLADPTGNRRFWPIAVDSTIDLGKLTEWRDQLWAEAVAAAKASERWWLDEDEDRKLARLHNRHEERHPWTDAIQAWLEGNPALAATTAELLEHAVAKPRGQWNRGDEMTVATILRQLGYERPDDARQFNAQGQRVRVWIKKSQSAPANLTVASG
jgi:hypothetical protein